MDNSERILKAAEDYEIVTFDVFDTLIIRDVLKPIDVHRFCYGYLGRYFRSVAEIAATHKSENGNVSLDDIDKNCIFSCKKEIDFEKGVCRANPEIYRVYASLKEQGKKMYAISDMYLDNKTISLLLKNAGYDIPVIVSSEYGCNKSSGKLFEAFLKKYSLDAAQVIHIGDDEKADIQGAKKAGIHAILNSKHENSLLYTKYCKSNYELAAFINHGLQLIEDPVSRIGYEIIGPIVMAFCQWVHERYVDGKFDRLYFLARDMNLIYNVYKSLYNEEVHYLKVSRVSLRNARKAPDSFCEYLKKEGCFGNVAVVDTGWLGVAQTEIEKYARMIDPATDIGGLYIGTKLAYRFKKRSARSYSCLYSTLWEQSFCEIKTSFVETLIGTNEKQVIAYRDGSPVYDENEHIDHTDLLKSGAVRFVSDWASIKHNKAINPKQSKRGLERLFYFPQKQHMDMLGDLYFENAKDAKIVSYKEEYPYWKHPAKWLSDLGDSAWKGAFIKKSGIFGPFLMFLYIIIGNFRIFISDLIRALKKEI